MYSYRPFKIGNLGTIYFVLYMLEYIDFDAADCWLSPLPGDSDIIRSMPDQQQPAQ